ncbi:DUF2189 domain-containing protein [Azospirillum sp. RWY-5-1]|uniref:DUF2189 domain-containing protein n=1 Tax=Azospirillum oleiclasticum TaxID=2735135 RepID=A0ABX2T8I9_9PROT|nr:DUF2189 domain-containing protein [Azospirillum oleiclasticum]NYZ12406.1 DUF2189 domain-containing protein [Azospirillum oleiclasticum]NYZ19567.1 DUF2189 domain-containing protein [Azospirillum oleiclasticum]
MVDVTSHHHHLAEPRASWLPRIRTVGTDRPWVWLAAGWRDMLAAPLISLAYGLLAVVSSFVLVAGLAMYGMHYLVLPMAAGFMLIGPVLAVGLYETSRRLERGEHAGLWPVVMAYRQNGTQIAAIGLALMVVFFAWIRLAFLIFMLFFSMEPPPLDLLVERIFFSEVTLPFLITGTVAGGFMAAAVFSMSVVAIPMLLDRDCDAFTAMATSITAVRENPRTMLVWAALIALFISAGLATGFVGLLIAFPLIGHASWHAYRDVVSGDR